MKIWKTKYGLLTVLPILLAFVVVPFLDSMVCDDFDRGAPFPGNGFEIRCKNFLKVNSPSPGEAGSDGQPSAQTNVHVFCPICFTMAEIAYSFNFDVFLSTAIFRPQPLSMYLADLAFPIDKPPQNETSGELPAIQSAKL